jgi:hypothetical protein
MDDSLFFRDRAFYGHYRDVVLLAELLRSLSDGGCGLRGECRRAIKAEELARRVAGLGNAVKAGRRVRPSR